MENLLDKFRELDTTCVSDACDKLGIKCVMTGIKPLMDFEKVCGYAFTVKYEPCAVEKGTVGDFLDDVEKNEVVVIDNGGRCDGTVWGDIMSYVAHKNNIEGTVIDGVCRDIPTIKELKYPIFSRGYNISTGKDRYEVVDVQGTVSIGGVRVNSKDIILGDDSGVICIPREKAEEIYKVAKHIDEVEGKIREAVKSGMTLKEARAKAGYHHLQTREEN